MRGNTGVLPAQAGEGMVRAARGGGGFGRCITISAPAKTVHHLYRI